MNEYFNIVPVTTKTIPKTEGTNICTQTNITCNIKHIHRIRTKQFFPSYMQTHSHIHIGVVTVDDSWLTKWLCYCCWLCAVL